MLLIAVNFDEMPAHVSINIPQHAFEYLKMPQIPECEATNLLNGKQEHFAFQSDKAAVLDLEPFDGKILKIELP